MQENKIEGYIYLSVDPRDFLTLSENNCNWRSCHTLDGDYRAGNLNYMVDKTTIVAYIANDTPEHLKCMPRDMKWFSKKWRMLIHTSINDLGCIYYNKPYPFSSDDILIHVNNFILTTFNRPYQYREIINIGYKLTVSNHNNWWRFSFITEKNYICVNQHEILPAEDVIDSKDYLGYCDLIYSSTYEPIANLPSDIECSKEQLKIKIGGEALCPCCGEHFIGREDSFLCYDCIADNDADEDFFFRCDDCGRRIYPEDEYFVIEETQACCKQCYNLRKSEDITINDEKEK